MSISLIERKYGALYGLYVADAVAMPVHWMYNLSNLRKDYGKITGYAKPLDKFQGSIMSLSNTGGGGRGSNQGDIVGSVILHGKKKFWGRGLDYHYHVGMQAGENTLEAHLTRLLTRQLTEDGDFISDRFRGSYMKFMQTAGSHPDTYAATAHRMFFKNLTEGRAPADCPDNDGHNVDAIDALTVSIPTIIRYAEHNRDERNSKVMETIRVLRNVKTVEPFALAFSDMLVDVLNGASLQETVNKTAHKFGMGDMAEMVKYQKKDPMVACYIESSFPAMLFMAYKYAHSVEETVLANANAGGENVARGSLLGALIGAAHGMKGFPRWAVDGLKEGEQISDEIERFLEIGASETET